MSCAPRVIGVPARLLLLLIVALLVEAAPAPASSSASSRPPAAASAPQRAVATVLPPIAQMGPSPQGPSRASTVVTARFRPAAPGRPVALELRRDGRWDVVERSRLDPAGRASFAAPSSSGGPATFRVTAAAYRGHAQKSTRPVASTAWGAPAFVDTFDGATLGPAWQHRIQFYNPWGGRSCSKGDPSAVAVGGGTLQLSVLADPARATETCATYDPAGNHLGDYRWRLNGHVSTQHSFDFKYGVAAARMRFQRKQGQHASFWLQPRGLLETGPTPWGAEIDVIEWYGEKRGPRSPLTTAIHRHEADSPDPTTVGGPLPDPDRYLEGRTDRWWRNYHVFSVEWTPRECVFRIDGQETMRTSRGVSHHPEFLILSLLSSDFELGLLDGEDQLPQRVDVDWVAAWPAR